MSDRHDMGAAGAEEGALVRHEEELEIGKASEQTGDVAVRKHVETRHVEEIVPRQIEEADVERIAPADGDSGEIETLPDGSVSIPILEEELVVSKRTVVRERILIRKRTVTEHHRVDAELRRERVDLEAHGDAELEGTDAS